MGPILTYLLLITSLILAILTWIAIIQGWHRAELIFKLATIIALMAWLWQVGGFSGWMTWFAIGLVFSLVGDLFLSMKPQRFLAGLIAFFFAHLTYIIGFNSTPPPANIITLTLLVLVTILAVTMYRRISASLLQSGQSNLLFPVLAYSLIIGLMVFSATATLARPEWSAIPSLMVSAGAISYLISDTVLAWNKFISPIDNARLLMMVTFHLGQIAIILGAAWHYLPL